MAERVKMIRWSWSQKTTYIEVLLGCLRSEARSQSKSAEELWQVLQHAWNNLPADCLIELQDSVGYLTEVIQTAARSVTCEVFCCCSPSASRSNMLTVQGCPSAQHCDLFVILNKSAYLL
ncbi:hypothetical protein COCON_G00202740 [Conger conger]|uniref:Uncharacterized protein n=1 Tax=Conger conger TaxID=82655 RepID=A0A9Q1CZP6_CONCO|nr:hypothetical protein COCON_G00202740 [Conger conger]